jgi:flagellar basal-body rod protein FlgF
MQSGLYVTLSAAVAVDRRMTTIAANIANQSTPGYRAEEISFKSLVSKADANPVHFVSQGESFISRRAGVPIKTDNPLDVAVQGKGWMALQTPDGTVYTKDGRMHRTTPAICSASMAIRCSTPAMRGFCSIRMADRRPSRRTE